MILTYSEPVFIFLIRPTQQSSGPGGMFLMQGMQSVNFDLFKVNDAEH